MALRIVGFLVKKVMIYQGREIEIMYLDLYKGLGIKAENFTKYGTPLVGFDGKMEMPNGQITLSMVIEGKEVMMNFIVVNAFSPYMAILARLWIHTMCVVLSTLHVKVKFPTEQGIVVVKGDQNTAWQYLVAAINHKIKQKEQVELSLL